MGWWITLGVLILFAMLPLGVSVQYAADGALVQVIVGPVKITIFPKPKKEEKPKKEKKERKSKKAAKETSPQQEGKKESVQTDKPQEGTTEKKASGGPITDFLPLVKTVFEMLGVFRRRLRVNVLEVKVIMAADDPADLAINYGRAWAAIGNLQPKLEQFLVIKKRKIEVECDFTTSQTLINSRLDLTITLGRLLATVVVYGVKALVQFLKINKKRKGGAAK